MDRNIVTPKQSVTERIKLLREQGIITSEHAKRLKRQALTKKGTPRGSVLLRAFGRVLRCRY